MLPRPALLLAEQPAPPKPSPPSKMECEVENVADVHAEAPSAPSPAAFSPERFYNMLSVSELAGLADHE